MVGEENGCRAPSPDQEESCGLKSTGFVKKDGIPEGIDLASLLLVERISLSI